jgi:NTE family protein
MFAVLIRSFLLAVRSNADKRKELCNVVIVPDLENYSPYNLWKLDELYYLGYKKTLEVMKDFHGQ